jgi:hypothetical protein
MTFEDDELVKNINDVFALELQKHKTYVVEDGFTPFKRKVVRVVYEFMNLYKYTFFGYRSVDLWVIRNDEPRRTITLNYNELEKLCCQFDINVWTGNTGGKIGGHSTIGISLASDKVDNIKRLCDALVLAECKKRKAWDASLNEYHQKQLTEERLMDEATKNLDKYPCGSCGKNGVL